MKSFLNFLKRNKLYTAINVLGLTVSIAFVLLLAAYVQKQLSTDAFHENADRIYLVGDDEFTSAYYLQDYLKERYPEIEATTAFILEKGMECETGNQKISPYVGAVDSSFFDIFSFRILRGNGEEFKRGTENLVVSSTFANRYFGVDDPIGKTVKFPFGTYTIVAVMEDIDHSAIPYCDVLMRADILPKLNPSHDKEMSNSGSITTFIMLHEGADILSKQDDMLAYFKKIWWIYEAGSTKVHVVPLRDIFFMQAEYGYSQFPYLNLGNKQLVNILLTVCLVLLVFSVMNYVNMTTAAVGFRAKEMASRRLLGAGGKNIFGKMIAESTLLCALAALMAVLLAETLSPYASELLGYSFSIFKAASVGNVIAIVAFVGVLGVLSGFIPAMAMMKFQPIDVVRGTFRTKTKTTYSKVIIIVQSMVTLCMLAVAFTMYVQIRFMIMAPMGYHTRDILNVHNWGYVTVDNQQVLKDRLMAEPFVKNVGFGQGTPMYGTNNNTFAMENGEYIAFQEFRGDNAYFEILGIKKKKDNHTPGEWWLNETALRKMGLDEDATSYQAYQGRIPIGGVYYDFKVKSLLEPQSAALIYNYGETMPLKPWNTLIQIEGDHAAAFAQVAAIFQELYATDIFEAYYIEDDIVASFNTQKRTLKILVIFTILSVLISALGLLAMSTYYMLQEQKNVALKKVFGLGRGSVLMELIGSFMKMVGIAVLIGVPVGWWIINHWLQEFSYRIPIYWWLFAGSALLTGLLSLAAVLWQSIKTANTNPAVILKKD